MESPIRSILKTLSWRFIATFITGAITYIVTGSSTLGITIGISDTLIKLLCYYFHERAWANISIGYKKPPAQDYSI